MLSKGYFVSSNGNIIDKIIKKYIKNQNLQKRNNLDNLKHEQL